MQESPVLSKHMRTLLELFLGTALNPNLEEDTRIHALTFVSVVAQLYVFVMHTPAQRTPARRTRCLCLPPTHPPPSFLGSLFAPFPIFAPLRRSDPRPADGRRTCSSSR